MITRRNLLFSIAAAPAAATLVSGIARAEATRFSPAPKSVAEARFPNVEVISHENKRYKFYDDLVKGKIVLINFFYAQCEKTCPPMTANLNRIRKLLGDRVGRDVFMYSLSLKPQHDTPEVLRDYAAEYEIDTNGWKFLTGAPENLELLRVKLGFRDSDPQIDKDKSQHTGMVLFGNDNLNRWTGMPALINPPEFVRSIGWISR